MEKKRKYSVTEKKSEVIGSLQAFGAKIYEQMEQGDFPRLRCPVALLRTSITIRLFANLF